ncbi:unnamed protein product, partial [Closterium sp. NIES-53]
MNYWQALLMPFPSHSLSPLFLPPSLPSPPLPPPFSPLSPQVLLTTPTTPTERMGAIADVTQGFLYLVSLTGVTGERQAVQGQVEQLLKDIKASTDKPVAVGFGISAPEHAEQ